MEFKDFKVISCVKNNDTNQWLVSNLSVFGSHFAYYSKTKKEAKTLAIELKQNMINRYDIDIQSNKDKALKLLNAFNFSEADHLDKSSEFFYI